MKTPFRLFFKLRMVTPEGVGRHWFSRLGVNNQLPPEIGVKNPDFLQDDVHVVSEQISIAFTPRF